ncbi:MAG TPA: hypothetical protein VMW24_19590, partial [Sedimentisphaerales bacterium]|nr:hypothetical protein [Sedimentisphaerales bacterium]
TITRFDDSYNGKRFSVVSRGAVTYDFTSGTPTLLGSPVNIVTAAGDVTHWITEAVTTTARRHQLVKVVRASGVNLFGSATNNLSINSSGIVTAIGNARWEREKSFTSVSLAPGSTGPDQVIVGNYIGESYDIGDDSVLTFEVPEDWDESTAWTVKIYYAINEAYVTASGEVQWRIRWSACPFDTAETIAAPTHTGTCDFGDDNIPTAAYTPTTVSSTIAAASLAHGDIVGFTVDRIALDGGTNPTADPVLLRIELHYIADVLGEAL